MFRGIAREHPFCKRFNAESALLDNTSRPVCEASYKWSRYTTSLWNNGAWIDQSASHECKDCHKFDEVVHRLRHQPRIAAGHWNMFRLYTQLLRHRTWDLTGPVVSSKGPPPQTTIFKQIWVHKTWAPPRTSHHLTYSLSNCKVSIVWRVRTCPRQEAGTGWHTVQSVCFLCLQRPAIIPYVSSINH